MFGKTPFVFLVLKPSRIYIEFIIAIKQTGKQLKRSKYSDALTSSFAAAVHTRVGQQTVAYENMFWKDLGPPMAPWVKRWFADLAGPSSISKSRNLFNHKHCTQLLIITLLLP